MVRRKAKKELKKIAITRGVTNEKKCREDISYHNEGREEAKRRTGNGVVVDLDSGRCPPLPSGIRCSRGVDGPTPVVPCGLTSTVAATVVSLLVVPRSLPVPGPRTVPVDAAAAALTASVATCDLDAVERSAPATAASSLSVELVPSAVLRVAETARFSPLA